MGKMFNGARFGLCFGKVCDRYNSGVSKSNEEQFKEEVKALYKLSEEAEAELQNEM